MNIVSIPTKYNKIQMRSRLEAKWAAFFDLCNWKWEYEPFDLKGWIPDFIIYGKEKDILVEIKPYSYKKEFTNVINKIITSNNNYDVLLLGNSFPLRKRYLKNNLPVLGFINEKSQQNLFEFNNCCISLNNDKIGLVSNSKQDIISGNIYNSLLSIVPPKNYIENLWICACNTVQWKKTELTNIKSKKLDMKLEDLNWDLHKEPVVKNNIELSGETILEDMKIIKATLKNGSYENLDIISNFIQACIKKYNETVTKYYVDNVFYRYFSYD